MLLSLSACGGDTLIGPSISYTVKGQGKKELKVSVTDKFEEEYTLEYTLCDDDAKFFEVTITKDEKNEHAYKISPLAVGSHSFAVKFLSGEKVLGAISLVVIVKEDGKIYYSDMSFNDPSALNEKLGENAMITTQEGGAQIIQLANGNGEWEISKYDEAIVTVVGPELLDNDKVSSFTIGAVGEGNTSVYLKNIKENIQMILNFSASKSTDDVASEEYILKFIDYVSSEIEKASSETAQANYQKGQEAVAEAATGEVTQLNLPEGTIIKEAVYFDSVEKVGDTDTDSDSYKPDILSEVKMEYNGYVMELQQSATLTVEDYYGVVGGDVVAKEERTLSSGDLSIRYYYLAEGVGISIWEESGIASRLTFTDNAHTSKEYQDMTVTLLNAGAL